MILIYTTEKNIKYNTVLHKKKCFWSLERAQRASIHGIPKLSHFLFINILYISLAFTEWSNFSILSCSGESLFFTWNILLVRFYPLAFICFIVIVIFRITSVYIFLQFYLFIKLISYLIDFLLYIFLSVSYVISNFKSTLCSGFCIAFFFIVLELDHLEQFVGVLKKDT